MINNLLSKNKILRFEQVLESCQKCNIKFNMMIDGGAGYGSTTLEMIKFLEKNGSVNAFEPNQNNHKFFDLSDRRIKLRNEALYSESKKILFWTPSVVKKGDAWASKGLVGYSSLGHIVNHSKIIKSVIPSIVTYFKILFRRFNSGTAKFISANRVDIMFSKIEEIDFVKLDLQGGEYDALIGFGDKLKKTKMMWIEFTGDYRVLDFLDSKGFDLYDTNYMSFDIERKNLKEMGLEVYDSKILSNNKDSYFSIRNLDVIDYKKWFSKIAKRGFIQTDMLAINKNFKKEFFCVFKDLTNE